METKNISRRNFINKSVIAGAAGIVGVSALSSCKTEYSHEDLDLPPGLKTAPDGKKLKAALIGCGNRGTGAALNFLAAGPNLELVGLADVFMDKVEDARKKIKDAVNVEVPLKNCFDGFDGYKRILELDVDIVLLVTPPQFRPLYLKECIKAGKHVFMEKPACVDPVGARSIMATAEKAKAVGLTIIGGTQRRHRFDYIETYKRIKNGAIGEITSAKAFWMQNHVWFRTREEGWNDMEYMIRNWNNFSWLCGDFILDTHVHNIDIINWFVGKHPESAIAFGGKARRLTGDQYDFFSVDFDFGKGLYSHSMCRQIDSCANGRGEWLSGTEGYTNCKNTIYNVDGSIKWQYEYPKDANGKQMDTVAVTPYIQEHIDLVTAIRTNTPRVEATALAESTLTAIMARTSAYTGKKVTWDEMMTSPMKLAPEDIKMGPVDMEITTPLPGTQHKA